MRKPSNRYVAFALLSAVFAFYTFRLNPEGLDVEAWVAVVFFSLLAVALLFVGIFKAKTSTRPADGDNAG